MAFDGSFLHKIIGEIGAATDCHIDKIYQPSKDELVFLLRKKGFVKKLLITIKPGSARLHFTENKYENPATPPNFCMLLRKYLSAARLVEVSQSGLERVAELKFSASNELGDLVLYKLICELIGNQANVILLRDDGRIIDAMRRSDVESAKRLILPGAVYEYPPSQQKLDPFLCDIKTVSSDIISRDIPISKGILDLLDGFSPLVCREIEYNVLRLEKSLKNSEKALETALSQAIAALKDGGCPSLVLKASGDPLEFSYIPIGQYGPEYPKKTFESYSALLDAFYTARDTHARIKAAASDIIKLVNNLRSRTEKKLALRLTELKKCENRDTLRIYGELLKANLHNIENGSSYCEVANYYDENLATVKIPLNPALSPARNAEKYFKEYKKTYTAEQTLTSLTEKDKNELVYLDSVLDNISRCETLSEISELKQELIEAGYIKSLSSRKKVQTAPPAFKEYTSVEGYRILVGKNNLQNDYITAKLASKNDLWFHVKNLPGSHVVVFCSGQEVSKETILRAASLAAGNSKAAASAQVPVDYTPIKYVKKPSGAKPGMVIYTTNKTVYVTPEREDTL